jgi:acetyl esterase/lipase
MNDGENRATVLAHDCVVVSVDYPLAPEIRWPGSLEDAYAGLARAFANGPQVA